MIKKFKTQYRVFSLLLLFLLFGKDATGQPFHYLDIGISRSSFNQLSDIYSDHWELSSVNSIQFRTPFYLGVAGAGLDFFTYTSKDEGISKISSLSGSAFFGLNTIDTKNIILSTGVLIGIQQIESTDFGENPIESELFLAFTLEPQIKLKSFILFSEFQYRRVFNFHRQNILVIGAGVKFRVNINDKLRGYID